MASRETCPVSALEGCDPSSRPGTFVPARASGAGTSARREGEKGGREEGGVGLVGFDNARGAVRTVGCGQVNDARRLFFATTSPAFVPPRRGAYDHVARRAAETGHRLVCVRAGCVWAKCPGGPGGAPPGRPRPPSVVATFTGLCRCASRATARGSSTGFGVAVRGTDPPDLSVNAFFSDHWPKVVVGLALITSPAFVPPRRGAYDHVARWGVGCVALDLITGLGRGARRAKSRGVGPRRCCTPAVSFRLRLE